MVKDKIDNKEIVYLIYFKKVFGVILCNIICLKIKMVKENKLKDFYLGVRLIFIEYLL